MRGQSGYETSIQRAPSLKELPTRRVLAVGDDLIGCLDFKGLWLSDDNYLVIRVDGSFVYEHQEIVAWRLGRWIKHGECIHHINGIKIDNRPENLLVCTHTYHHALHMRCLHRFNSWHLPVKRPRPPGVGELLWEAYKRRERLARDPDRYEPRR